MWASGEDVGFRRGCGLNEEVMHCLLRIYHVKEAAANQHRFVCPNIFQYRGNCLSDIAWLWVG